MDKGREYLLSMDRCVGHLPMGVPMKDSTFDLMIAYETEDDISNEKILRLFSELVKSGDAWRLQGHYGQTAKSLIDGRVISPAGQILQTT